ncbi:sugar phosphate isomerase/epimerase family protein [Ohessyouella blattaphilus]|uniref:Sugar phosphate isomerase/epimerase n=1 Tax=Ohessyouella blattaphilus TaxID=2949333 RepID=A0ABT1EI33_9FIRM|nr:sugar phosphate isomerase/epimerase [Ohessyouella blattaphilus]MCP1108962.1 sugar phosphate isomerase/epimerase [Ohessyouella blattaphilus]MCR8562356.1 sugar phosphate isomerase/epimerase [Ohessyouella blattaphilus]
MTRKAVQQIMLGTVTRSEKEALDTLRQIKAAGYDGLELNGFMIRPSSLMVRLLTKAAGIPVGKGGHLDWPNLLKETGLGCVSLHEDLRTVTKDPKSVAKEAEALGCDQVVITGMYRFDYGNEEAVKDLAANLNTQGERLKEEGISLLYHNHNCEFRKVAPRRTAFDVLVEETNPEFVNFEFDSYWPTEAGVSALALMEKLGERLKLYHINDRGTRVVGPSMTPILKSDSMELGFGNMNLEALTRQALKVGVKAIILESHKNWIDKSPVKSLQVSSKFLNKHL